MAEQSVYQTPAADLDTGVSSEYGGLRRLPYFLYGLGVQVVYSLIAGIFAEPMLVGVGVIAMLAASVYLGYQRFVNIGSNGWWALMIFVPIANIYFGLKALAWPEGYDDHKTMDTAGKIIIGLFVIAIVLGIAAAVMIPTMLAGAGA